MLLTDLRMVGFYLALAMPWIAVGQYGAAAVAALNGDDAGIVIGQPLTIVEKTISITPLTDGTKITKQTEELKWRDSQGRFRKEVTTVREGESPVYHVATIIDPVKNTVTILNLDRKTANVVHLREGQLHPYVVLDDKQIMAMRGVIVKEDKLDPKTIAGVYAEGRRVTRTRPPGTVGNDKVIVSVSERWVSPDLKTLLASSMNDPREQQTREVTGLERGEPDAKLFEVPADYALTEASGGPLHLVTGGP